MEIELEVLTMKDCMVRSSEMQWSAGKEKYKQQKQGNTQCTDHESGNREKDRGRNW